MVQVKRPPAFIARHALWTDEQRRQAQELKRRVKQEDLRLVRLAWADPHGAARAKAVTVPVFLSALESGYNINVATTTLDSANARTFASFTRGGGMGLDEMTGSPNLTIVPDPSTFRMLPWAPGVGWVLCDEYFNSGVPFHFSPRHLLRRQLERLANKGMRLLVGLEIEWYLLRVVQDTLGEENIGFPGVRGQPIKTAPAEPGFSYHSESNMDLMQPVLSVLADHLAEMRLPLSGDRGSSSAPSPRGRRWRPRMMRCCSARRHGKSAAEWDISPPSCAGRRSRAITPAAGTSISRSSTARAGATCSCPKASANIWRRSVAPFSAA
jgi:glutamine synthetase